MGVGNQEAITPIENQYFIAVQLTAGAGVSVTTMPAKTVGSLPFVWEGLGAKWNSSNGDWDIRIIDNGSDLSFSAEKVSVESLLGGSDKTPWKLDHPHTFAGGSSIMVEATNNGSGEDTLKLTFIGKRIPPTV